MPATHLSLRLMLSSLFIVTALAHADPPSRGTSSGGGDGPMHAELTCLTQGLPTTYVVQSLLIDSSPMTIHEQAAPETREAYKTIVRMNSQDVDPRLLEKRSDGSSEARWRSLSLQRTAFSPTGHGVDLSFEIYLDLGRSSENDLGPLRYPGLLSAKFKGKRIDKALVECTYSPNAVMVHFNLAD